ncbi:MAG: Lrp/AsnC family transcriptional regulator [Vannielia sp.]|uniref:Lrp/AsnC family transcriptional regulator n=1 Tax=Vannielia sp. TaxID=2813045 RepID=UPI003B8D2D9B
MDLTDADRIILGMLQSSARERLENIAFEAGISLATVQRRIRALKEHGFIEKDVSLLSPPAMGFKMTFVILIELERERLDQLDAFKRKIRAEPQVQQCYYITGDADFALIALARDMDDYQELTHRLFFDDSNVKRFRTSVVMDRSKVCLDVPVDV